MLTLFSIGQHNKKIQLLAATQKLRKYQGGFLNNLLQRARCGSDYCKTLEKYESSDDVIWNGIKLHEDLWLEFHKEDEYQHFIALSEYADAYLDAIDAKLEEYMPEDELMETMAALDQTTWSSDFRNVTNDIWLQKVAQWPLLFNMNNYTNFEDDIMQVMTWIDDNKEWFWCKYKNDSPTIFWTLLLISASDYISEDLEFLIKSTLCSPYG